MNKDSILRGDIFYADLGDSYKSEQGGERPVLVIQNNVGNRHSPTTIIAPITSALTKHQLPTHVLLCSCGLDKTSMVLLEQIRTISRDRLTGYIGQADSEAMRAVDRSIKISLGLA